MSSYGTSWWNYSQFYHPGYNSTEEIHYLQVKNDKLSLQFTVIWNIDKNYSLQKIFRLQEST